MDDHDDNDIHHHNHHFRGSGLVLQSLADQRLFIEHASLYYNTCEFHTPSLLGYICRTNSRMGLECEYFYDQSQCLISDLAALMPGRNQIHLHLQFSFSCNFWTGKS